MPGHYQCVWWGFNSCILLHCAHVCGQMESCILFRECWQGNCYYATYHIAVCSWYKACVKNAPHLLTATTKTNSVPVDQLWNGSSLCWMGYWKAHSAESFQNPPSAKAEIKIYRNAEWFIQNVMLQFLCVWCVCVYQRTQAIERHQNDSFLPTLAVSSSLVVWPATFQTLLKS